MTLDQIVKLQSIVDKRAIRSDTLEFLDHKRYSKSKEEYIRYGDMHIDHFLIVCSHSLPEEYDLSNNNQMTGEQMFNHFKEKIIKEFGNGNN